MLIQHNISLLPYNTFGIDVPAQSFTELHDTGTLPELTNESYTHSERKIIGGGSNVLLTKPVSGLVILNKTKGKKIINEDEQNVWLEVASGEIWHDLVIYAIANDWGGIENLALIPGTVGAAPIQNIGAYGVEVKDLVEKVCFWHWKEQTFVTLNNNDCRFGYRDSIFKQELRDQYFIKSVVLKLHKQPHQLNVSYGAIREEIERADEAYSIGSVANAVIAIRSSKLPDPKVIGNAGSFFKNPVIPSAHFTELSKHYPSMPFYKATDGMVKIPAGWLIEQCGWKGFRDNDAGVHARQALVLVNYGHARGDEIWQLSGKIVASVYDKFSIGLEREVQVW